MIAVFFGTTAEVIKLFPVLRALGERQTPVLLVTTGQQASQIPGLLARLGLPQPDLWLGAGRRGSDLERLRNLPLWGATVLRRVARHHSSLRRTLRMDDRRALALVHGDTMTTVLGAWTGRLLGVPVAHLEAGLRSDSWHNPFPEELDRRATSRLANVHLAPGPWAVHNLRRAGVRGEIVDIGANTIYDSLRLVTQLGLEAAQVPSDPFGLVSLHRQELLGRPRQLRAILELLSEKAQDIPLRFINHPITAAAIADANLGAVFHSRFQPIERQSYPEFIALLQAAAFLVTDSGGSQEECATLGLPCLVHRATTERLDGLEGGSVLLSRMDLMTVRRFLADPEAWRRAPTYPRVSPTDRVLGFFEEQGFV